MRWFLDVNLEISGNAILYNSKKMKVQCLKICFYFFEYPYKFFFNQDCLATCFELGKYFHFQLKLENEINKNITIRIITIIVATNTEISLKITHHLIFKKLI